MKVKPSDYPDIERRLRNGETLERVSNDYDVCRERIRQIAEEKLNFAIGDLKKAKTQKVDKQYKITKGVSLMFKNKKAQLGFIEMRFLFIGLIIGIILTFVLIFLANKGILIPFRLSFVCP